LSLSGLSILFIYGGIALAHIRFRKAWHYNGHSTAELPYRAAFGVWGSWLCLLINIIALMAQFYVALYPIGGPNLNANNFFQLYLAGPLLIFLYLVWKVYSWFVHPSHRPLFVRTRDIDIYTGMREEQSMISGPGVPEDRRRASIQELQAANKPKGVIGRMKGIVGNVI